MLASRLALGSRAIVQAAQRRTAGVRNMSGHGSPEEVFMQKEMWLKTTAFMIVGLVIPYTTFVLFKELTHEHHHGDHVTYPHMKVRRKAFPWGPSDCDFFEIQCWRDAAKGAASSSSHH